MVFLTTVVALHPPFALKSNKTRPNPPKTTSPRNGRKDLVDEEVAVRTWDVAWDVERGYMGGNVKVRAGGFRACRVLAKMGFVTEENKWMLDRPQMVR